MTGTRKGINLGNLILPLDFDFYTQFTIAFPNSPYLKSAQGILDPSGRATASFNVPKNAPVIQGLTLFHAYLVFDAKGRWVKASNAVPLRLF